jgi:hypothetical protein
MAYVLEMSSDVYGTERFEYDSEKEREEGRARIEAKVNELNDGIEREFNEFEEV